MLTGEVPKYIDLLMEAGVVTKDEMLNRVTRSDSPFLSEDRNLQSDPIVLKTATSFRKMIY